MIRLRALTISVTLVAWLWGVVPSVSAEEFRAKVSRVLDGDTVEVRFNGRTQRIELRGIDCPELRQPYGRQAKRAVRAMVSGIRVGVRTYEKDEQGQVLADLFIDRGRRVSQILLKEGLGWRTRSGPEDEVLDKAEAEARYAKRGLWSERNPVAPWVYRASKSRTR